MKKIFALFILVSLLFISCKTTEGINQENIVDTKIEAAVTLEQLRSLEKDQEREADIVNKIENKITYGFDLLDELSFSISWEKQQAYNAGYEAGKRDAQLATEGYIKLEDLIELLRQKGLLEEESE